MERETMLDGDDAESGSHGDGKNSTSIGDWKNSGSIGDDEESDTESPLPLSVGCLPRPSNEQKIVIDNIDYRKKVHFMTQEHQTSDNHFLTVCATTNRVHGIHLSSKPPEDGMKKLYNGLCIPSHLEQSSQRDDYIRLIERCLVDNLPCLEFLKDVVSRHIPHTYSKNTSEPTETVSNSSF